MKKVNVFWFRRDLRLEDNHGLYKALHGTYPVLPIFIFDTNILSELSKDDARVTFIHDTLQQMRNTLEQHGASLGLHLGTPENVFHEIQGTFDIQNVITNHDYEPYATARDAKISEALAQQNIGFYTFKDQVIYETNDIVKGDGTPYVVYTPYMKKWKALFRTSQPLKTYPTESLLSNCIQEQLLPNLSLSEIGFTRATIKIPDYDVTSSRIQEYEHTRNFPAKNGTSRLGPHLRFGTVSVRQMVLKAIAEENETFWQELIWREFFMQILWHFPHTVDHAFRKKYDLVPWRNKTDEFKKWKNGTTGFPLVDAGMRELNETGHMHNRVRMLVASFLCKHLLIDWRWGEAYFAEKLLDYELASNVGNWQWAAGSGVDAAPYFRIFNPTTQIEKFDKDRTYIKQWVAEYGTETYPTEMVNHKEARLRALETYKNAIN